MAFNANDIWRWRCEFSKQLQDLHIDVDLFSETYLKPSEKFFIENYHFYRSDSFPERKDVSRNHVDLGYMYDTYT
jgi:hypothetical protein